MVNRPTSNATMSRWVRTNASDLYTFPPRDLSSYRIVIKNLRHSTVCTDISATLLQKRHSVKPAINVKNKNECSLPMIFIDLIPCDNNIIDVYKITSLLNTVVSLSPPINLTKSVVPPPPSQCHQCQSYGDTWNNCHRHPICVKCSENHQSEECTKDQNSLAKCAFCAEDQLRPISRVVQLLS